MLPGCTAALHELTKVDKTWCCQVCHQTWRGKPRSQCPGAVVYTDIPAHLKRKQNLAAENLKPIAAPAGCILDGKAWVPLYHAALTEQLYPYPILRMYDRSELRTRRELQSFNRSVKDVTPQAMMWWGSQWEFLYRLEDCPIADSNLPPIYPWNDRPEHLKTPKQLVRFNLKPGNASPKGCSWTDWAGWIYLYNPRDQGFELLDPGLPHCYLSQEDIPDDLKTKQDWKLLNRVLIDNPRRLGCYRVWESYSKREGNWNTLYLYPIDDTRVDDPLLPVCYLEKGYPAELKTEKELQALNLAPGDVQPRGCYRQLWYGKLQTILLYHPDDCGWHPPDNFLCKTTLRRTYLLSDGWIKRLGEPDRIADNPHHEKWSEMILYSRQRVESWLAENAEEYAQWLTERDRYIAIFERNREAIEAGRTRAIETRRELKRLERERRRVQRQAAQEVCLQRLERQRSEWEARRQAEWEAASPRQKQTVLCLRCASGCATPGGFFCAIHPMGLEDDQLPCIDWQERGSRS